MGKKVESNGQIVASYLDAVLRKDHSAVDRFFDPKVDYFVNGTSHRDPELKLPPVSPELEAALPWLGHHRGQAGVKAFLETMHGNLEVTAYGPREVISEGRQGGGVRLVSPPRINHRSDHRYCRRNSVRAPRRQDHQVSVS